MEAPGDGLLPGDASLYGVYLPHRFVMWSPKGYGFFYSILELDIIFSRSSFVIIIDKTINKSSSHVSAAVVRNCMGVKFWSDQT